MIFQSEVKRNAHQQSFTHRGWVIRERTSGLVIGEMFDAQRVAALNTAKYEAVPILEYLQRFNAENHTP